MFFTGFTRFSSDVQKSNNASGSEDKKAKLKKIYELVDEAEAVLTDTHIYLDDFGRLRDSTWKLKKARVVLSVLTVLMSYIKKVLPQERLEESY